MSGRILQRTLGVADTALQKAHVPVRVLQNCSKISQVSSRACTCRSHTLFLDIKNYYNVSHLLLFFNWAPMFRATGKSCIKDLVTSYFDHIKMWHTCMTEEAQHRI